MNMRKNELYYELIEDEKRGHKTSKYDFSSFVQVKSSSRKATEEILWAIGKWRAYN